MSAPKSPPEAPTLPPTSLFKYRQALSEDDGRPRHDEIARAERLFLKSEVFFASPRTFNDAFDCSPLWRMDMGVAERDLYLRRGLKRHHPMATGQERRRLRRVVESRMGAPDTLTEIWQELMGRWGVFCLGASAVSPVMWGHYTNSHRGYCLEFHFDVPEWTEFGLPIRVRYATTRPIVGWSETNRARTRLQEVPRLTERCVLTKAQAWAYEDEWRIVRSTGPGLVSFPPRMLTAVILGVRMSEADQARVCAWLARRQRPVRVYRAEYSTTEFAIERRELSSDEILRLANQGREAVKAP